MGDLTKNSHSARDNQMSSIVVHHGPLLLSAKPSQGAGPMRGILRSLPSQPTINSLARTGNRFIPRPDELVSYGGGVFDADRPYPLMMARSGADGVLNAPVFHGTPVSGLETTRPVRGMGGFGRGLHQTVRHAGDTKSARWYSD